MTLVLNLPPDLEVLLKKRAASAGLDVSSYFLQTLKTIESEESELSPPSSEPFQARLQSLIDLHLQAPAQFDDSRDSMYAGRGE